MKAAEAIMTEDTLARLAEEVSTRERSVEAAKQHLVDVEARQKAASVELAALEAAQGEVETALAAEGADDGAEERLRSTLAAAAMGRARLAGLGKMCERAQAALDEAAASLNAAKAAHEERRQWEWREQHLAAVAKVIEQNAKAADRVCELALEINTLLGRIVLSSARAQHLREKECGCSPRFSYGGLSQPGSEGDTVRYQAYSRLASEADNLLRSLSRKLTAKIEGTNLRILAYYEGAGSDLITPMADASAIPGCGGSFIQSRPSAVQVASPEAVGF